MGLAIVILIIVAPIAWMLRQSYKEGKDHRDYMKGKPKVTDDLRDVTERFYDDEIFPEAFKRKSS